MIYSSNVLKYESEIRFRLDLDLLVLCKENCFHLLYSLRIHKYTHESNTVHQLPAHFHTQTHRLRHSTLWIFSSVRAEETKLLLNFTPIHLPAFCFTCSSSYSITLVMLIFSNHVQVRLNIDSNNSTVNTLSTFNDNTHILLL